MKAVVVLKRIKVETRGGSRYPWTYWYNGEHNGQALRFTTLGNAKDWASKNNVKVEVSK